MALKLTIAKKMLLGYLSMSLLTIAVGAYALYSLHQQNQITKFIVDDNFPLIDHSKDLVSILLAQERSEKKFLVSRDPDFVALFQARGRDFQQLLTQLQKQAPREKRKKLGRIGSLHAEYGAHFLQQVPQVLKEGPVDPSRLSQLEGTQRLNRLVEVIKGLERSSYQALDVGMVKLSRKGERAAALTLILGLLSLLVGIVLAVAITLSISSSIKELKRATQHIAEGDFDYNLRVKAKDEVGELAHAFRLMAQRLKKLEEINLDASPLTRLPGNLVIQRRLEELLKAGKEFALCHSDLDNFKAYADRYGYAWASEVIKETARILESSVKEPSQGWDFVGHIGGDDFVIILTDPSRADAICSRIVQEFDRIIPSFYSLQDVTRGYIEGHDRRGMEQQFPLMSISLAVVTVEGGKFHSPLEVSEACAELKEYAKSLPGSNYVKDIKQAMVPTARST